MASTTSCKARMCAGPRRETLADFRNDSVPSIARSGRLATSLRLAWRDRADGEALCGGRMPASSRAALRLVGLFYVASSSFALQLPLRVDLPCGCCASSQVSSTLLSSDESKPSEAAVAALQFYKKYISPLIPPGCRFIPTCSEYGALCFEQFTIPQAIVLTAWRLVRCNPLHFPGTGFGNDLPVWPPCAYWAGDGQIRTFIDDERSRQRANGELEEEPLPFDPIGLSERGKTDGDPMDP